MPFRTTPVDISGRFSMTSEQVSIVLVFLAEMESHLIAQEKQTQFAGQVGAIEWATSMQKYINNARKFVTYAARQATQAENRTEKTHYGVWKSTPQLVPTGKRT